LRGLDLNQRPSGYEAASTRGSSPIVKGKSAQSLAPGTAGTRPERSSAEAPVTLSHDPVRERLAAAIDGWSQASDRRVLRRALLDLLRDLEGDE
jgi:hypothetical protein